MIDVPTEWKSNSLMIENILEAFGIVVRIVDIHDFKQYTKYCLEVAVGTSLEDILNRSRELAMATASPTGQVQIEAPIPGRALVGISIPKTSKSKINLLAKPIFIYSQEASGKA
jgi:DNA segregation ATPase FtsK/SpoIIIE, S-DNA-T family